MASTIRSRWTCTPAARSTRPNTSRLWTRADDSRRRNIDAGPDPLRQYARENGTDALASNAVDVFLILEEDAERLVDDMAVEHVAIQGDERRRPVERFGNTGGLVQIRRAKILHEGRHLPREAVRRPGHLGRDNAVFLFEIGIRHPAVHAAPLQRVVDFARAI